MDKSSMIRQLLEERPDLSPKEIQDELADRGVHVSRNLCKVVRHRERNGKRPKRRSRGDGSPRLRQGERRMGRTVRRLKDEDFEIWDRVQKFVESLDDPSTSLHRYDGRMIERLPEVRSWIRAASSSAGRHRRHDILEQFVNDLKQLYPPPDSWRSDEGLGAIERRPYKAKFRLNLDLGKNVPMSSHEKRRRTRLAEPREREAVHEQIAPFVERHSRLLDLCRDLELVDLLLSIADWHFHTALLAMTNSYSSVSALNDLLLLGWPPSKLDDLPQTLVGLYRHDATESSKWRGHPEISELLFLLALWITERVEIAEPDGNGRRRLVIGRIK